MHHFNQPNAFICRLQILAVAHDVFALNQHFDDGSPRRRSSQTAVFHGVGKLFLIQRLACRLHRGQQRSFRQTFRSARLLAQAFRLQHVLGLTRSKPARQSLFFFLCGLLAYLQIQDLPPHLLNRFAGGMITVRNRPIHNRRNHGSGCPDMIGMPRAQQTPANQVINLRFIRPQRRALRRSHGRNNGVVVADLRVIHKPFSQRFLARTGRKVFFVARFNRAHNAGKGSGHILRNMPAVGSRIADQLVALI